MLPTKDERKKLAQEFASDVHRMRNCLQVGNLGQFSDDELVWAWTGYSHGVCTIWLGLPDDDSTLLNILRKHLPQKGVDNHVSERWYTRLMDAGDGTGDGILELPDGLLAELGWEVGDKLDVALDGTGDIVLRKSK